MRRLPSFFLLAASLFVLTGCPIGLDYALGTSTDVKIDTNLLGQWTIDDPEETILSVSFAKKTESTYQVTVNEYSEMFTPESVEFTAWIVSLGGMRFLCMQENANPEVYYHYVLFELSADVLKVCDLSLLHEGMDAVKSTESLRNEVLASMKKTEFTEDILIYQKVK
jgi:hypothetical protein